MCEDSLIRRWNDMVCENSSRDPCTFLNRMSWMCEDVWMYDIKPVCVTLKLKAKVQ